VDAARSEATRGRIAKRAVFKELGVRPRGLMGRDRFWRFVLERQRMAPPERLLGLQRAGKLGRKSSEGFYRYD
jgi:hypothetical protein